MNIAIFFGGKSAEHSVSCISASYIYENLNKSKYHCLLIGFDHNNRPHHFVGDITDLRSGNWRQFCNDDQVLLLDKDRKPGIYGQNQTPIDLVIPVMHGPFGEDGKLQGLLDFVGIPYVGGGVLSDAICMDKDYTKRLLKDVGIPQVPHAVLQYYEKTEKRIDDIEALGYPLFVKPANMGSSVGVSKVKNREELLHAIQTAFDYDDKLVIEKGYAVRELELGALGNQDDFVITDPGEIASQDEFYDYNSKYINNTSVMTIPAEIPEETKQKLKEDAKKAYRAINGEGLARIDFFIDKETGAHYLNEINSFPGFTPISMYPALVAQENISYSELLDSLIELAVERSKRKNVRRFQ